MMILLGLAMIVTGAGGGDRATFEFFGLKVNQATPGVVFALLGTYVVKVTAARK